MKKLIATSVAAAFATAFVYAAPADDVKAAAKKLADASGYSWTSTTENAGGGRGFGGGKVTGKTEKNGYTVTARETPNGSIQTARKGEQMAMQNFQSGEWMSAEEMRAQFGGGGGGGGGGRGRGGRGGGMFGAQQNPAEEVDALAAAAKDLKMADGAIVGTLGDEDVARRLTFGGRGGQAPAPKNASGTVKFWLKDGALVKYSVQVKGTVAGRDGQEREMDRTTTTELSDVGSTKVTVPEEAKKKLGA